MTARVTARARVPVPVRAPPSARVDVLCIMCVWGGRWPGLGARARAFSVSVILSLSRFLSHFYLFLTHIILLFAAAVPSGAARGGGSGSPVGRAEAPLAAAAAATDIPPPPPPQSRAGGAAHPWGRGGAAAHW